MVDGFRSVFWPIVGSLIIATGATIAGLFAFEGHTPLVILGFLVFTAGYVVSQFGVRDGGVSDGVELDTRSLTDPETVARSVFVLVGLLGISVGVTTFSQTILDPSLSSAVLSGVSSITGYMCAHVGINGVGLGDSFFGPVFAYLREPQEE